jgi:hypothetical protein
MDGDDEKLSADNIMAGIILATCDIDTVKVIVIARP